LVSFSSQSYILLWVLLELNFLSFIVILNKSSLFKFSNKTLNYFLIQSVGRGLILITIFMSLLCFSNHSFSVIYFLALLLKLGGAPFHIWYLRLIKKLSWGLIWVLSIWQKLIPLLIIRKPGFGLLVVFRVARVGLSRFSSFAQKNIKKVLGLSSIFSLGWILVSFNIGETFWVQFIRGYGVRLFLLVSRIESSFHRVRYDFKRKPKSVGLVIFFFGILIVRGIPPFIGFFIKILILIYLIQKSVFLRIRFLIFRLIFIYVYINMAFLLFTLVVKSYSWGELLSNKERFGADLVILNLGLTGVFFIFYCN